MATKLWLDNMHLVDEEVEEHIYHLEKMLIKLNDKVKNAYKAGWLKNMDWETIPYDERIDKDFKEYLTWDTTKAGKTK